jgi:hypothetical protein
MIGVRTQPFVDLGIEIRDRRVVLSMGSLEGYRLWHYRVRHPLSSIAMSRCHYRIPSCSVLDGLLFLCPLNNYLNKSMKSMIQSSLLNLSCICLLILCVTYLHETTCTFLLLRCHDFKMTRAPPSTSTICYAVFQVQTYQYPIGN